MKIQRKPKKYIGERVSRLRKERLLTQTELARVLGLSQNRLSEIENGHGSFTAEQLLAILKKFNVPIDYFAAPGETGENDLQNALARLGAGQIGENRETLPSDRLKEVYDVAREILVSAQYPRLIPRLASVIIWGGHTAYGVLNRIRDDLKDLRLGNRFGWFLENTKDALGKISRNSLTDQQLGLYEGASHLLKIYLGPENLLPSKESPEDTLEVGDVSEKTLIDLKETRSSVSRKWRIITRIQPSDFESALRESYEQR